MADRLAELLEQIHDAANGIGVMAASSDLTVPDAMYVEPSVDERRDARGGPSLVLKCREHYWYATYYPWGGGGRVGVVDVIEDVREHLEGCHGD